MSYCRQPYYIYPNINEAVVFDIFGDIPDEVINIFLYKLYNFHNDEFVERTEKGKKALDEWNDSIKDDKVLQSIEEGFKQVGEYKQGKRKFKSLKESQSLWDKWAKEVENYIEDVDNGKIIAQESLNSLIKAGICNKEGDLTEPYKAEDTFDEMMKVGQDFRETLGISLKEQLKNALVKFSYGQLNEEKAEQISEKSIDKIDLTNSVLNHKGINWWAKEILSLMGIPNNKYQTLNQIKEKNRTDTTLLGSEIEPQDYSEELINQCKEEFDTFVKPIRNKVVGRIEK